MQVFEIVFDGELMPGAEPEQVRANLMRLFQADAQRIDALFAARRILKSGLDEAAAQKYRVAMAKAGARVQLIPLNAEIEEVELAPPPADDPVPSTGRLQIAPRDEYMAAFAGVDAPDFGLVALGSDLQDERPDPVAPSLDLTGLSLAPLGTDLGQAKTEEMPAVPDVSHLKLT